MVYIQILIEAQILIQQRQAILENENLKKIIQDYESQIQIFEKEKEVIDCEVINIQID